jgi:transcriptional regulator with XRE-family HTH domain
MIVVSASSSNHTRDLTTLFAARVQQRRRELNLSVEQAAELAGIASSEWQALESGWVPEDRAVILAIAGALEVHYLEISFLAEVARLNKKNPAA